MANLMENKTCKETHDRLISGPLTSSHASQVTRGWTQQPHLGPG